jgi:glycosyltransferase involved in cell wall biosynthesis
VLPMIRRVAPRPFTVSIVGAGIAAGLDRLGDIHEIRLRGAVPDVAPWYRASHAAIVPLRAGGGTRIKIIEAFSYRRPVVSTSVGSEGLAVRNDEHLLIADTPFDFARACARLMAEPDLSTRLVESAYALFTAAYSTESLATAIAVCEAAQSH